MPSEAICSDSPAPLTVTLPSPKLSSSPSLSSLPKKLFSRRKSAVVRDKQIFLLSRQPSCGKLSIKFSCRSHNKIKTEKNSRPCNRSYASDLNNNNKALSKSVKLKFAAVSCTTGRIPLLFRMCPDRGPQSANSDLTCHCCRHNEQDVQVLEIIEYCRPI